MSPLALCTVFLYLCLQVLQASSISRPNMIYCHKISWSYQSRSLAEVTVKDAIAVKCEGFRLAIVCMYGVICTRGLANDTSAHTAVSGLLNQYRQLCQQGEDFVLESQTCPEADDLCGHFLLTCERRVLAHYKHLLQCQDMTFISCETFKIRIQCFEEFICSCSDPSEDSMHFSFQQFKMPYEEHCMHVPGHVPRRGDVTCKSYHISENIMEDSVQFHVKHNIQRYESKLYNVTQIMKSKCPLLDQCADVTSRDHRHGQSRCEAIKEQVLCQAYTLCYCPLDERDFLLKYLESLFYHHNITCSEELHMELSVCIGSRSCPSICFVISALCLLKLIQDLGTGAL